MSDFAKGPVIALGPEDGESFWQPLPSTGYVINKINPYNAPYDSFSTGLQILEPGAHIRRHAHEPFAAVEGRHGRIRIHARHVGDAKADLPGREPRAHAGERGTDVARRAHARRRVAEDAMTALARDEDLAAAGRVARRRERCFEGVRAWGRG